MHSDGSARDGLGQMSSQNRSLVKNQPSGQRFDILEKTTTLSEGDDVASSRDGPYS